MSLLVTGSIGIDTVHTPFGKRVDLVGGSAVYFSCAAAFFTPVRLVGAVGEDCPPNLLNVFEGRPIDASGVEVRKGSKTFRWHGSYVKNLNEAETVHVHLNVLGEHAAPIPTQFLDSKHVFLANSHPRLQRETLQKLQSPMLVVADTMNLWIENEEDELLKLLPLVHGLILNDAEVRMLTQEPNLVLAARKAQKLGPKFVIVKKGEHGCLMVTESEVFVLPAYPLEKVVDPTGAGDSFAGGMIGYLSTQDNLSPLTLKRALAFGTVVASFTISDFSLDGLKSASRPLIDARCEEFRKSMTF